ncbi:RNA-directed DNA polymerase from transposon X, partial [Brachionus plicatilis]
MQDNNNIKIAHLNCHSLNNKFTLIINYINNEGIDILCLNETFLKKNASNLDTLQHYNFIRNDRSYTNGGGIGILIKKKFKFKLLHQSNNYNGEQLILTPKAGQLVMSNHKYAILLGDLNAHHISWYNKKINKRGYSLMKILDQHNLSVINDASHTYKSSKSIIDLIITTEDLLPKSTDFNTNHSYNISDHWPVQINIILKKPVHTTQITNWDTFNISLAELTHVTQPSINTSSDLNNEVAKFNCNIVIALSNATKYVKTKERPIKLPPDVKTMIKIKVKLQRLFSNTQNQLTKNNINNINHKIKRVTLRLRHEKWNSTFATLIDSKPSEKQFWNKLKTQTESAEALPNFTLNSDEKVESFAKHFEQAFTTNYKSKPKQSLFKYYTTNKHNTPISNTELDKAISDLKNTNSKGLD